MFCVRYIGHTVYRLSTYTGVAVQKWINCIDVRSAMVCTNVMKITVILNCDNMWLYYLSFDIYVFINFIKRIKNSIVWLTL